MYNFNENDNIPPVFDKESENGEESSIEEYSSGDEDEFEREK